VTDAHHDVTLPIDGAADLGYVRQHVREFLAGVGDYAVADAVLVVVMLAGDACRSSRSPITVRLRRLGSRLRVEVAHHGVKRRRPTEEYRAVVLDRITDIRGIEHRDGGTTTWAEVVLTPQAVAS
jgi:hypothetical protein